MCVSPIIIPVDKDVYISLIETDVINKLVLVKLQNGNWVNTIAIGALKNFESSIILVRLDNDERNDNIVPSLAMVTNLNIILNRSYSLRQTVDITKIDGYALN